MSEICICAAVIATDGTIVRGHRHGNSMRTIVEMGKDIMPSPKCQGFITSYNRYVTREEGRKLQDAAGVKSQAPEGYRGKTLFSEDLY